MYMTDANLLGTTTAAAAAAGATASGVVAAGSPDRAGSGPAQEIFGPVAAAGTAPSDAGAPLTSAVQAVTELPFTGVNVFFLVLTAITLLMMGATLVRIGRTLAAPASA